MLTLKKICKSFGPTEVLHSIDLTIEEHQIVALLGPNGAGKTTLMRVITGFLQANKGAMMWKKETIDSRSVEYKKKIGYLPENNPLYTTMTIKEYLEFIAQLKNSPVRNDNLVEECGLTDVWGKKIETLSKGYKQRVGLAAALWGNPQLVVLDEPTSGLDPNQIIEIRDLIKKMAKKKTILLSTHILPEAKAISDRIIIINRGKVALDEETKKVKNLEKKFVALTTWKR